MNSAIIASIVTALLYIAVPGIRSEINQGWGTSIRQRAEKIAADIYTKLMSNNKTKDQLMEAFNRKDNDLMSALINQAGYSSQASALRKQIQQERKNYKEKNSKLVDQSTQLTNQYNKIVNAGNAAGTSISANNAAEKIIKDVQNDTSKIQTLVNGGEE
jgi:hypothetical protein